MSDAMQALTFNPLDIKRIAAKRGIDLNTLPTPEEIEAKTVADAMREIQVRKARTYYNLSIWPDERPLKFEFKDWDINQ